jgi:LuxR family maltose regulon positive regulatory protein
MKTTSVSAYSVPAKLTRPKAHSAFPRIRLFERLDAARERPAVWISSPAGAGKTVLLSAYLQARNLPCLWYQVDEGDGDIASFFHYLRKAAQRFGSGRMSPLPALTPEYLPGLGVFTRRFFEELYQRLPVPSVLVLDNYHDAPEASLLHEILRIGAGLLPAGVSLIILSRTDPPPDFARLRAHGELDVIGFDELALTLDEAQGIAALRQTGGVDSLKPDFVAQCHTRAQGWTAGLVLLLEQGKSRMGRPLREKEFSRRLLFDYFALEIFAQLPALTKIFLLETAMLPKMTSALAVELTGNAEAGRILTEFHRKDFFILKREEPATEFEYHPLFREFLVNQAKQALSADIFRDLLSRSGRALMNAGKMEDAMPLYLEAGDWDVVMAAIQAQASHLLAEGRHQTLNHWLDALPSEMLEQSPWLLYWRGMGCLPFDQAGARRDFEQAFAGFELRNDAAGLYLAWASVVESFQMEWRDFKPLDPWIAAFDHLHERHPVFPTPEIERRVFGMLLMLNHRQPQHPKLALWADQALTLLHSCSEANEAIPLGVSLLIYYLWIGDLVKTGAVVEALRHSAQRTSAIPPLIHTLWQVWEAMYLWIRGEHRACLDLAAEGLDVACATGMHVWDPMLLTAGVYGNLVSGDLETADGFLRNLLTSARTPLDQELYYFLSALVAQQRGDFAQGREYARQGLAISIDAGTPFPQAINGVILTLSLFECNEDQGGQEQLGKARAIGQSMGSRLIEYLCVLTEARIALERNRERLGLERLARALRLGREMGGCTMAWWGPVIMARLYAKALEAGIEVDYVRRLIRKGDLVPPDPENAPDNWPWPVKIDTLGAFSVTLHGKPLRFTGKAQQKPLELLMALIALGGTEVSQQRLADVLWPDAEGDAAYRALITTVHRLRKLLDCPKAVLFREGRLSLNSRCVWVDAHALERLLDRKADHDSAAVRERVLALCRGPFLAEIDEPWVVCRREHLNAHYQRYIYRAGQALESSGQWQEAVRLYQKSIEANALAEAFHQYLIRCHIAQGQIAEARAAYDHCQRIFAAQLGKTPSQATENLIRPFL